MIYALASICHNRKFGVKQSLQLQQGRWRALVRVLRCRASHTVNGYSHSPNPDGIAIDAHANSLTSSHSDRTRAGGLATIH